MDNGASSYRRFLDGDESAFNEIMEELFRSLVFFINGYVHDIHAAEDIAIDAFSDLVVHRHRYNFKVTLKTYEYDESKKGEDLDENLRLTSVVPFQLAYAVSIHKAQGLEYDSVKVIIPSNNAEKITHGIFYTAITRAKTNLKIYWSSETMHDVVKGFATDESKRKSLEIVKTKLGKN